jgi:Tfp pilus assembly protein PilN
MKAVNLIPSEDRRGIAVGAGRSQGAAYAVLGVLAGLAVLALLFGMARHQASNRRAQLASLVVRTQHAQESVSQLSAYTSFMTLREQRMQSVDQLVDSRFDWAHALHELGRVMPHDASITSLDGTIGAVAGAGGIATPPAATTASGTAAAASSVTSATPPGSVPSFTLSGCADSQSDVALALQRLRLVDGVSAVSLTNSAKAATSGTGAGGSTNGHCKAGGPTFTVQLTFDPLPTPSASTGSAAKLTSTTGAQG